MLARIALAGLLLAALGIAACSDGGGPVAALDIGPEVPRDSLYLSAHVLPAEEWANGKRKCYFHVMLYSSSDNKPVRWNQPDPILVDFRPVKNVANDVTHNLAIQPRDYEAGFDVVSTVEGEQAYKVYAPGWNLRVDHASADFYIPWKNIWWSLGACLLAAAIYALLRKMRWVWVPVALVLCGVAWLGLYDDWPWLDAIVPDDAPFTLRDSILMGLAVGFGVEILLGLFVGGSDKPAQGGKGPKPGAGEAPAPPP